MGFNLGTFTVWRKLELGCRVSADLQFGRGLFKGGEQSCRTPLQFLRWELVLSHHLNYVRKSFPKKHQRPHQNHPTNKVFGKRSKAQPSHPFSRGLTSSSQSSVARCCSLKQTIWEYLRPGVGLWYLSKAWRLWSLLITMSCSYDVDGFSSAFDKNSWFHGLLASKIHQGDNVSRSVGVRLFQLGLQTTVH